MSLSSFKRFITAFGLVSVAACGSTVATGGTGTGGHGASSGSTSTTAASSGGTGGLGSGGCRAQGDCPTGYFCGVTVLPPLCGGQCANGGGDFCTSDADCADGGADVICGLPCECFHGGAQPQNACTKGCSDDADCGPSMTCDATHRCTAAACTQASDCTANFTCASDSNGKHCAPKSCTADAECSGFCVTGSCSPLIGECSQEVP